MDLLSLTERNIRKPCTNSEEVGSFIEAPAFYGNLTGEENLDIVRKNFGLT